MAPVFLVSPELLLCQSSSDKDLYQGSQEKASDPATTSTPRA